MTEGLKKVSYYQKNKKHYQRGGKYYKYVRKGDRVSEVKVQIRRGNFIISFD